jgi:hypothetical protein
MMASHRPADSPPEPIQPKDQTPTPPPAAGGSSTLPPSSFLAGFDWVLAFGVLALAFLLASFAVRNSDFWMHLATGRLLAQGEYSFGKDPFSFVGADRTWINHAWLFDLLLYQMYSVGGGPGVVIAKAVALALAAGLLLVARRPGDSMFPSAVCVSLALIACCPWLSLQPTLASLLCLAVLLAMIVRLPKPAGSWRFPILVAVLFWTWANLDQWFFLGPAALVLYTAGQYVRRDEGDDPTTLWKAVGLGVLACTLTPHHYRVWVLPPELVDSELARWFAKDGEFSRLFVGVFDKAALDFGGERDNPANVYSLVGLLVLSAIGFAVNYRRASIGLGLVWLGAVVLAAVHVRAFPFLAFVAAPVAAMNLAAWGRRLAERPMQEQTVRVLHALRSGGRAAVGIVLPILIALTYAGWLHPYYTQRRWAWDLQPDPSMKQAAEQIHAWRQAGLLPAEARMLNLQSDFAPYVYWYAPGERAFFDSRLRFHRPEAQDYAAVHRYFGPRSAREQREDTWDLHEFLRQHEITHAVTAHRFWRLNLAALAVLTGEVRDPAHGPEWVLWHVDGRAVIMGWTRQRTIPSAAFARLQFDPIRAAYAEAKLVPAPEVRSPVLAQSVWERFVAPASIAPSDGEEAFVLLTYRTHLVNRIAQRHQLTLWWVHRIAADRCMTPALSYWTALPFHRDERFRLSPPIRMPASANAVSLLAVRAARRALAASPDHPDGYYYLAKAYPEYMAYPTFTQDLRDIVTTANLARCRVRLPEDPGATTVTLDVLDVCGQLVAAHAQATPKRIDLHLDMLKLYHKYDRFWVEDMESRMDRLTGDESVRAERDLEDRRRRLGDLEREIKTRENDVRANTQQYVDVAARYTAPLDRAAVARRFGLVREAITELYKSHESLSKQFSEGGGKKFTPAETARYLAEHAELIELLLYDGRAEEAAQILESIEQPETLASMEAEAVRNEYFLARRSAVEKMNPNYPALSRFDRDPAAHYRGLRLMVSLVVGDFERAVEVQRSDIKTVERELDTYRTQNFPNGIPADLPADLRDLQMDFLFFFRPLFSPIAPLQGHIGGLARLIYINQVQGLRDRSQWRVNLHVRLALTYLEWGDVKSAVQHFRHSLDSPEFKEPLPAQRIARDFLAAIDEASGPRGTSP